MKRHIGLLLWILVALLACAYVLVTVSKAGGDILPLAVNSWVYGSAQEADGLNMAGVTVSMATRTSTTNASGSWGFYCSLGDNQVYTLDIQLPEGYMVTGAGGPGITGWEQDCLTFQTGDAGQLCGPFQIILTQTTYPTPTPPPYLYPPSIWPWPITVPLPEEQIAIADAARQARGGPLKPIEDMQGNRLWQVARNYQLGAQLGQEYVYNTYRCLEFAEGIVIVGPDGIGFGVVSAFGTWGSNLTKGQQ